MQSLKELLTALHKGETIVLETRENQYGDFIAIDTIYFSVDGRWMRGQLSCWSSSDSGFGSCQCYSHKSFSDDRISRKEMLSLLRAKLRADSEDEAARASEIAWLEAQLASLSEQ